MRINILYTTLFLLAVLFTACEEEMTEEEIATIGTLSCRKPAPFIKRLGFDPYRTVFSTERTSVEGLEIIQIPTSEIDTLIKSYRHPTWIDKGYVGSVTTDEVGNGYTYSIPFINTLKTSISQLNKIYKIDNETGTMSVLLELPSIDSATGIVPFGVLGIHYDCHGKKLYVSSVAGSTRESEVGAIYAIDPSTGKIIDQLKGIDAMGLCVTGITGDKKLLLGKGRFPEIYSVLLSKEGKFKSEAKFELSLDQLGPRGDDKARKIKFDKEGSMFVYGVEFNYSLIGMSEKPETIYKFGYDQENKKWGQLQ